MRIAPLALCALLGCDKNDGAWDRPLPPTTGTPTATPSGDGTTRPTDFDDLDAAHETLDRAGVCDGQILPADLVELQRAVDEAEAVLVDPDAMPGDYAAADQALAEALAAAWQAEISHRDDLQDLLAGVTTIAAPGGAPSQLGVVGCNGLAVFQHAPWRGPTIAAGRIGDGRILVFSKEIQSSVPALADRTVDADMTQLAENALTWLTERNPAGYDGATPMKVLVGHGYASFDADWALEHVPIADPVTDAALFDPATHPLAIVNPRIEDPAEAAVLRTYVASGGALLMGHQVWTWNVDVETSEGQRLLADAGLLWRDWYGTQEGPVPPVDQLLLANTTTLMDWLDQVEGDWANHTALGFDPAEIGAMADFAVASHGWLPRDHAALVGPLKARYDAVSVSYPADLAERPHTQVAVPLYHRVMGLWPGQDAGKGVATFPGEVDPTVPRVDATLTVDFDHADPSWLEVPVDPRVRLATGRYAPPGEDVTLEVTARSGLDVTGGLGLNVVVGAHSDNLSSHTEVDRPPLVAFSEPLQVGTNVVNNPYGGLIYLDVPGSRLRPGQAEVRISGAVQAPSFFSGPDDGIDFAQHVADHPAPWGDIVGEHMIVTLPHHQLAQVAQPEVNASSMDQMVEAQYDLMGLDPASPWPNGYPAGTWHFVEDRQISAGWMHSGYPIMAFEAAELHDPANLLSWGPYHELGHNLQQAEWKMAGSGEVSNNLFSLFCQARFEGGASRLQDQGTYATADQRLADGDDYAALDVWEKLTFYRRLSLAYGWDFYRDLFTTTRELHAVQGYAAAPGQSAEDYLLVHGSRIAGESLTGFFDHYGVPVSQAARDEVSAMGLPEPAPAIWTLQE